jgi:hypothetical protein
MPLCTTPLRVAFGKNPLRFQSHCILLILYAQLLRSALAHSLSGFIDAYDLRGHLPKSRRAAK